MIEAGNIRELDKSISQVFDKIKQLDKGLALDLHRSMFSVEHDTVLIVVDIRRILESPLAVIDRDRNDAVILSGRVIEAPCTLLAKSKS